MCWVHLLLHFVENGNDDDVRLGLFFMGEATEDSEEHSVGVAVV